MSVNLFTKEQARQMKQKYDSGLSAKQLAEKYYCSVVTIRNYLRSVGYTPHCPKPRHNIAQLLHDWNAGQPAEHFRRVYGIDQHLMAHNVARWRKMGCPFRYRKKPKAKGVTT